MKTPTEKEKNEFLEMFVFALVYMIVGFALGFVTCLSMKTF